MVNIALASWLGGWVGAAWFLALDVHGCKGCLITDKNNITTSNLPYNGAYGIAGFFGLCTVDYLLVGWLVNGIRILVTDPTIPFFDALNFLHSNTMTGNMLNG